MMFLNAEETFCFFVFVFLASPKFYDSFLFNFFLSQIIDFYVNRLTSSLTSQVFFFYNLPLGFIQFCK